MEDASEVISSRMSAIMCFDIIVFIVILIRKKYCSFNDHLGYQTVSVQVQPLNNNLSLLKHTFKNGLRSFQGLDMHTFTLGLKMFFLISALRCMIVFISSHY